MTQRAIDGPYIYFVTTNVAQRRCFFVSPERAGLLKKIIITACQMKNFELLAFCILPNHVHLLVRNLNDRQRTLEKVRHKGIADGHAAVLLQDISTQGVSEHVSPLQWRGLSSPRNYKLGNLMQSMKGSFSRVIGPGQFWQSRSIFTIVENEDYLSNLVYYISTNYQKMNLGEDYGKAPFVFLDWEKIGDAF